MHYLRAAGGALLIFAGLAVQVLGSWLHRAGWLIECAGNRIGEGDC